MTVYRCPHCGLEINLEKLRETVYKPSEAIKSLKELTRNRLIEIDEACQGRFPYKLYFTRNIKNTLGYPKIEGKLNPDYKGLSGSTSQWTPVNISDHLCYATPEWVVQHIIEPRIRQLKEVDGSES